ncbi:MAG: bestrophin family ion channel [Planctomycetota bacterium]|nr:bestrophin family ion channel [Planctomycetota bacterium]
MIVLSKKRSWLRMVFAFRGSVIHTIWPRIAVVTASAAILTYIDLYYEFEFHLDGTTPFGLVGFAMAIFLGFRNNESYERFWEGRKLWGRMVNVSRSYSRQVLYLINPKSESEAKQVEELQRDLVRTQIAYVHSFRHHLRDTDPSAELTQYLSKEERDFALGHWNRPNAIIQRVGLKLREAWYAGFLDKYHLPVLEESLTEMLGVQGGCERIKSTPLPFTYNVLIHRIVAIYCLAMPFGLIASTGWATPLVVCLISYALFGLDAIGDEVEQPFELDDNDLPLDGISRTIEINLLEMIDDRENLPKPLEPTNGVLL